MYNYNYTDFLRYKIDFLTYASNEWSLQVQLHLSAARPESSGDTSVGIGLRVTSDARSGLVDERKGETGKTCTARGRDELSPNTLC